MITTGIAIALYMALYTAALGERGLREIIEISGLLLGVSLVLYVIGRLIVLHLNL